MVFEISEYLVDSHADVSDNIFKQTPSGPGGNDNVDDVWPEVPVVFLSFPSSGK